MFELLHLVNHAVYSVKLIIITLRYGGKKYISF